MLNKVLFPMTGLAGDGPALAAALAIADDFDAHLEALFVRPHPADAVPLLGEGMSGAMIDEIVRAADQEGCALRDMARRTFDTAVAEAGVAVTDTPPLEPHATAWWTELTGHVEEIVTEAARYSDLVVFGHPADDSKSRTLSMVESVLIGGGRPVLLVPAAWSDKEPREIGRHVALAWNGRTEAARAALAAMPFLQCAEKVAVLTADTAATETGTAERMKDYLAWRRIIASVTIVHHGTVTVAQALIDSAKAQGCDLLVLGGYGHSRMRELILGGVTRYMLNHAALPVLLAH